MGIDGVQSGVAWVNTERRDLWGHSWTQYVIYFLVDSLPLLLASNIYQDSEG